MQKGTKQQIQAELSGHACDVVGQRDADVIRRTMLRMGASEEEADRTARFIEQQNETRAAGRAKAS